MVGAALLLREASSSFPTAATTRLRRSSTRRPQRQLLEDHDRRQRGAGKQFTHRERRTRSRFHRDQRNHGTREQGCAGRQVHKSVAHHRRRLRQLLRESVEHERRGRVAENDDRKCECGCPGGKTEATLTSRGDRASSQRTTASAVPEAPPTIVPSVQNLPIGLALPLAPRWFNGDARCTAVGGLDRTIVDAATETVANFPPMCARCERRSIRKR